MKKKALIIVESPAKIKTLKKLLGPSYEFASSVGHIRDLPEKGFGIDIEHNFTPEYKTLSGKKEVIENLQKAAKKSDLVYLGPDPDREGEAIAWHIAEILPKGTKVQRITFHAITKEAVLEALKHPGEINIALVNAQQARRLLDRIVGYKISPILQRRVQRSLSAGRVQSIALKFVVDREKQIEIFIPVEYWNLGGIFLSKKEKEKPFRAFLYSVDGKRVEKEGEETSKTILIPNQKEAKKIVERIKKGSYHISKVEKKEKKRHPFPPFITSTLQQEASRHFGFSPTRTMGIAQSLYEGVDLGEEGTEGLITYMRTDSVRVEPQIVEAVRKEIVKKYGKEFIPEKPNVYSTKKSAQDAHEAIRPSNLKHPPEMVKRFLTKDQFQLYELIWKRFFASQMSSAIYDTVSADITSNNGLILRATGSTILFLGFLTLYEEKHDDEESEDGKKILPELNENEPLTLQEVFSEQAFTRPPPRYNEATLIKELEKSGIGRPSTYASIMNKIQSREYTVKEKGRLKPTELGRIVTQMLETNFSEIMNVDFTSNMEDDLERVADNEKDWKTLLKEFWEKFSPTVEIAEKEAFVPKEETSLICPKCGGKLQKIWARSKYFYGCSNYPDCDYTTSTEEMEFNKDDYAADFDWDQKCPTCQSEMKLRFGKFGAFLGCSRYPDCKGIVNIPKKGEEVIPEDQMPSCPAIGCPGKLTARKSRFGKTFYSCSTYPDCDVIVNSLDEVDEKYPHHERTPYVKKKKGKNVKKAGTKTKATRTNPEHNVSKELQKVVGDQPLTRGQVMKKLWDYIKEKNLQNPSNKRQILPDENLAKVFGSSKPIDMFQMTKLVSKHIQS